MKALLFSRGRVDAPNLILAPYHTPYVKPQQELGRALIRKRANLMYYFYVMSYPKLSMKLIGNHGGPSSAKPASATAI
jgi:hypothetical protein